MPAVFPHHYEATVELTDAEHAEGTMTTEAAPALVVGPPPQFDGRPGHQSPEEMLLGAIATCNMTTLVALTKRKGVPIRSYRAQASGVLEKTKEGLRFTSFKLHVEATTEAGREEELERLIHAAEGFCIISGALKLEVELEVAVTAA